MGDELMLSCGVKQTLQKGGMQEVMCRTRSPANTTDQYRQIVKCSGFSFSSATGYEGFECDQDSPWRS